MAFSAKVITTKEWGAKVKGPFARTFPRFIVIHHTTDRNISKGTVDGAKEYARIIQRAHLERGFSDSGHNFLNTNGGIVCEGRHGSLDAVSRGFCVQSAHARQDPPKLAGGNVSPGIENEGNFELEEMAEIQWKSLVDLCAALCQSCNLSPSAIRGHQEFSDTLCPGKNLMRRLPVLRKEVAQKLGLELADEESQNFDPKLLRLGSEGDAVKELQELLRQQGFKPGASDGIFGENTKAAVIAFQKAKGLTPDGVVGPKTQEALKMPAGVQ